MPGLDPLVKPVIIHYSFREAFDIIWCPGRSPIGGDSNRRSLQLYQQQYLYTYVDWFSSYILLILQTQLFIQRQRNIQAVLAYPKLGIGESNWDRTQPPKYITWWWLSTSYLTHDILVIFTNGQLGIQLSRQNIEYWLPDVTLAKKISWINFANTI